MPAQALLIDIAEFISNPVRTGVQRTVRQLIANWPSDVPAQYVRYDVEMDCLVSIPDRALQFVLKESQDDTLSAPEIGRKMKEINAFQVKRINPAIGHAILIPELFYEHSRVKFYEKAIKTKSFSPHFVVYDFIPWLNPDAVRLGRDDALYIMPYLKLIIAAEFRSFISNAVKCEFAKRIQRQPEVDFGPVMVLGADGLKLEKQKFDSDRRDFVCLGSLDGKKRQDIPFEAFRSLGLSGEDGVLKFIGGVLRPPAQWMEKLVAYQGPDVRIIDAPKDDELYSELRSARALVFTSTAEGFGLPALEGLACGFPIVVHAGLPAIEAIEGRGQIRLDEVSPQSVAAAFRRLRNDSEAARLWKEVATLSLPTWKGWANSLADWIRETPPH